MPEHAAEWERRSAWLFAAILVARLAYLSTGWTDLSPDEAYYWEWSRRPDWCYYSKPPMVAWVIGASTAVFGHSTWAVRLPAVLLGTFSLAGIWVLARRLFDARVAFWAAVLSAASPGASMLGLLMTIDPPLMAAWAWGLVLLQTALRKQTAIWWAATGAVVALGILSKPSMLIFPVLVFAFLAAERSARGHLSQLGPWVFLAACLTALVPIAVWNASHEWITFSHASSHFRDVPKGLAGVIETGGGFLGTQLAALSPLTWALMVVCFGGVLLRFRQLDERARLLFFFSAIPLAGIELLSTKQRVHGNWSAPFYCAGEVLLAAWACGALPLGGRLERWRGWLRPAAAVGAASVLCLYALPVILPATSWGGGPLDATIRSRGWKELGREVSRELARVPAPERTLLIAARRKLASELAFYMDGNPIAYMLPKNNVSSQYGLWPGPRQAQGWDALYAVESDKHPHPTLLQAFDSVEPWKTIEIRTGPGRTYDVDLFLARGLRAWPTPRKDKPAETSDGE